MSSLKHLFSSTYEWPCDICLAASAGVSTAVWRLLNRVPINNTLSLLAYESPLPLLSARFHKEGRQAGKEREEEDAERMVLVIVAALFLFFP
jgi:hypothetical protein